MTSAGRLALFKSQSNSVRRLGPAHGTKVMRLGHRRPLGEGAAEFLQVDAARTMDAVRASGMSAGGGLERSDCAPRL